MGMYIQDDFWEACECLPRKSQDELLGALVRLYFKGEDSPSLSISVKPIFVAFRDRVKLARKKSDAAHARWGAQPYADSDAQVDAQTDAEADAQVNADAMQTAMQNEGSLNKREREKEKEKESKNNFPHKKGRSKFSPPTFEEAEAYRIEANLNQTDTSQFLDHYEANGWVQGRGKPVKDWKACMRNWNRRQNQWRQEKKGGADYGEYEGSLAF